MDPTRGLVGGAHWGFSGQTLSIAEQRRLFRRWSGPDAHPNEALVGMLALLHALSNVELRGLRADDVDEARCTLRVGRRALPVPLDPVSLSVVRRCLTHRSALATHNSHLIVTTQTKTRATPASTAYLCHVLDPAGTSPKRLRSTRIVDLITVLDPKVVGEALGMTAEGLVGYLADHVDAGRLPWISHLCVSGTTLHTLAEPVRFCDPEVGRESDAALQVPPAHNLEKRAGGFAGQREVAHFINYQKARAHVKAHRVGPSALQCGSVAARREVSGGRVVGAHPSRQGGMAQADGEHGLSHTGRADQQHVGGVFDKAQRCQLVDELFVDRRLGRKVEVGERERRGQGGKAGQAGAPARSSTALTSTASSRSKKLWWVTLALAAWSSSPGRASAAAVIRKKAI